MTLVMLFNGNRVYNAFQSIKEALRLSINNISLLFDIAEAFVKAEHFETSIQVLEYALTHRSQGTKHHKKI